VTPNNIQRPASLEAGLQLLASSLIWGKRDDGSEFRSLSETCAMREELQNIVRACHLGELPNDWCFETVYSLCQALLEYSEPEPEAWSEGDFEEILPQVAESLTEVYNGPLLQWLADNPGRASFYDSDLEDAYGNRGILELARIRQTEEIETMGRELLHGLAAMVGAEGQ
jgi:hypothetical protein